MYCRELICIRGDKNYIIRSLSLIFYECQELQNRCYELLSPLEASSFRQGIC